MTTTGSLPPWAVPDDLALESLPDSGFIKEYVTTVKEWTDCPTIYHIGSCLSMLATLCGQASLRVRFSDRKNYHLPIRMWNAIIGDSGDRKSQAMRLARACMMHDNSELFMPTDGTIEAWHDALSEDIRPRILNYDELSMLLDFSRRSYAPGMVSWFLALWEGNNHTRLTKANGKVTAYNPRLNILGGIPPDVFAAKTHKADWASGFLARWGFFAGRRTRYQAMPYTDEDIMNDTNQWALSVPWKSVGHIIIDKEIAAKVSDWVYDNVEMKRDTFNSEIFSALNRLQDMTFIISALIDVSKQTRPVEQHTYVTEASARDALKITEILYGSLMGLFLTVSSDVYTREESVVLAALRDLGGSATVATLVNKTGFARSTVKRHLNLLSDDYEITVKMLKQNGRGRPQKLYKLD